MRLAIIAAILIMGFSDIYSQGFDWQYSPRMPFKTPTSFIGLTLSGNYNMSSGKINYIEDRFPCCDFKTGSGIGAIAGISTEFWTQYGISYGVNLNFDYDYALFKEPAEELPMADGSIFRTDYKFESRAYYIDAEPYVKYKIGMSHFFVGATANMQVLISSEKKHFETVTSEHTFNDGSKEREIADGRGKISDLRLLVLQPKLRAGYDFSVGLGKYATVFVNYGFPIMDIAKTANWKSANLTAGFCIYTSLF